MSTSAVTMVFASFLNPSRAVVAIATTYFKQFNIESNKIKHQKQKTVADVKRKGCLMLLILDISTSLLNGGYLPSPGVALADAETMSASTR